MTEAELIHWAGYYELKIEEEKKAIQRQKSKLR